MGRSTLDANSRPTIIGVDNTSFVTPIEVAVKTSTHEMLVNSTNVGTLIQADFDYIGASYPDTSTEIYTYKTGGGSGTTVGTITVVYSDAVTKQIISSVTKT